MRRRVVRVPPLRTDVTTEPLRWGIAGTGVIAARFASAIDQVADAQLVAVASRSLEAGQRFAADRPQVRVHDGYESLAGDVDVDVVYVATPHHTHRDQAMLYLRAGKHVLCEKPLATSERDAAEMFAASVDAGRFLMEGMWTLLLPAYRQVRSVIDEGHIGVPLAVSGSFGVRNDLPSSHRLLDPEKGGGALLDLGVYPLHLAQFLLGEAASVVAAGTVGPTGVDETVAVAATHSGGALSTSSASIRLELDNGAIISGSEGSILVPPRFHNPAALIVNGRRRRVGYDGEGFRFQIAHVHERILGGHIASDVVTPSATCSVLRVVDEARALIGVACP